MYSGTGLASQAGHKHAPTDWKNFHKINHLFAGATGALAGADLCATGHCSVVGYIV
jgi:hypothetical protein